MLDDDTRNRIRGTRTNSDSCLRIEITEKFFVDLSARNGVRNGGAIGYARASPSKNNFTPRQLNHFITLPPCGAMGCVLNSSNSSNAWHKAATQTFRRLSNLPVNVGLRLVPRRKTSRPIEKRSRSPETATGAVEILFATGMSA